VCGQEFSGNQANHRPIFSKHRLRETSVGLFKWKAVGIHFLAAERDGSKRGFLAGCCAADLVLVHGVDFEPRRAKVGREAGDQFHLGLVRGDDTHIGGRDAPLLQGSHHLRSQQCTDGVS
jgi:hypothetical protein